MSDDDDDVRLYEPVEGPGVPIKRVRGIDEQEADADGVKHGCMFLTMEGGSFKGEGFHGTFCVTVGGTAMLVEIGDKASSNGRRYLLDVKDVISAALVADRARAAAKAG